MDFLNLVDYSRAQFALTALYHWLFVPLTLGLTFIVAIMETIYYKTKDERWKTITKFWMGLLAINFAIGLATGIIMEFEFGTNWSNYSWIVGDIFGAPLAIEGLMAFFMESTFFAVMFFGWDRVSKKMHLTSTWLVAIGSNLSALWILIANGWMQHPVGMKFNPDTARNEMENFWEVLFNPNAVSKFLHTVSSGYVLASLFVIGISAWYLLKNKEKFLAKRSIVVASSFGLLMSIFLILTGDESAYSVAQNQPMKLATMEALYKGKKEAPIIAFGIVDKEKQEVNYKIEAPYLLSLLGYRSIDAYVPGIDDLLNGNKEHQIMGVQEKMDIGIKAVNALKEYKKYKKENNTEEADKSLAVFRANEKYFGYGYLKKPEDALPNVELTFYSFHTMVALGSWFMLLFAIALFFAIKDKIMDKKWLLRAMLYTIPLGYLAQECGWIVAEVGRQPWAIQDLLPVGMAVSNIPSSSVQITFWLFAILFTALLIAEIKIMVKQIKLGTHTES